MIKLIDDAVKVLRGLPDNVQEAAARAIIDYGAGHDDEMMLSDEQVTEVEKCMTDPNRKFLSMTEERSRLRHFGV